MNNEQELQLPSGRKVKLKVPGPIKLARVQRTMQSDNLDGTVEMMLAFIKEPSFSDENEMDDFFSAHLADFKAVSDECVEMMNAVAAEVDPLSETSTSA